MAHETARTLPDIDEVEGRISHVIPSVELKGSVIEKLRTLDTLIDYLERLRTGLEAIAQTRGSAT